MVTAAEAADTAAEEPLVTAAEAADMVAEVAEDMAELWEVVTAAAEEVMAEVPVVAEDMAGEEPLVTAAAEEVMAEVPEVADMAPHLLSNQLRWSLLTAPLKPQEVTNI